MLPRLRLNSRASWITLGSVAAVALGAFVATRVTERTVRADVLAGASAAVKAGKVDLAVRNLQRFLATHPGDVPALEMLARVSADSARSIEEAAAAAGINDRLLRIDPEGAGRQETRRRLVELYVRCGDWHRASAIYRLSPENATFDLRYKAAETIARELVKRPDSRPGDHRLLATALEGLAVPGAPDALAGAVAEYGLALRGDPKDQVSAERLAMLALDRLNDPARGEKVLDALLAALPASPEVRLIRYRFFSKLRRNDRAADELRQATRLSGSDVQVRLTAAGDAIRRGDGVEARRHLDAIPAGGQDDLRVRVLRGMVDFNEERPDDAIDGWRQGLLTIGGTDSDLTWWLAHALLQMGRVAEARPLVAQYRRLAGDETQPLYRFLQAELDEKTGRPGRAIISLEWARDRIGEFWQAMVHMALGRCYEAIWDQNRALAAYRRANQIDPRLAEPRIAAARLLATRPDEAALEIERGLSLSDEDPGLRVALVGARLRQQMARPASSRNWSEFDRAMARALSSTPGNSALTLMQADRLAESGDIAGAVVLLEDGTRRSPKNAALWIAWAEGLRRLGRLDEALKVLERASGPAAAGDHSPVRIARAKVLLAQGKGREAAEGLVRGEKGLAASDRPPLWEFYGRIKASRGDEAGARAAFTEWARLLPDDPRPRLSLVELGEVTGDASAVRATVEALRAIGGPEDIAWRLSRAQELLWLRTESDQPLSRRDPRLDESRRLIEAVLVDAPEIPSAHLLRGEVMERLNRPDEALASYRRASDRGSSTALTKLVDLLTRLRRFEELAALKLKVAPVRLDQLSALASYRAGDIESASRFVEQAGLDGPKNPGTRVWQAQMLEVIGKKEESEAVLRSLAEQAPEAILPWLDLIRSQARHGKGPEARATVERARKAVKDGARPYAEALLLAAAGDMPGADRAFLAAVAERPGDAEVLNRAAQYFDETGRKKEAIGYLRAARKASPADRNSLRQEVILLAADPGTWPDALGLIGPDDSAADAPGDRLARGIAYCRAPEAARRARSIPILESLLEDLAPEDPIIPIAREYLARVLLDSNQPERARQVVAVAAESGSDPATMRLHIECLLQTRKFAEAIRQIDRLEVTRPGDPATSAYRVRWVRATAKPGEVARALELVVRERADRLDAEALGRAAFVAILQEDPKALDQAEAVAGQVVKARPSASWMAGRVLARRGRAPEALEACRPSVESESAEDRRGAAEVATDVSTAPGADESLHPRAEAILGAALRRDPKDYSLLVMNAMFRHAQRRFEDEARLYREALAARPGDPLAINNLAWALSEGLDRPAEALKIIDELIASRGRAAWMLDTRGVVLTRLGRFDEAIVDLKESGGPQPPSATLYHLARACLKANREQDFRQYRDQARRAGLGPNELDPDERAEMAKILAL